VSTLGDPGAAYVKLLFGRRMVFENPGTNRVGTLAFRIGRN
jgi:hypothetical protein